MLEVVWDTTKFNDKSMWADGAKQPFVLSTMDGLGLGQHADYVFGCGFAPPAWPDPRPVCMYYGG